MAEPEEEGHEYRLVVPFLTDDPDFVRGWEAGLLYADMRAGKEQIEGWFDPLNEEQHHLTARWMGYESEHGQRTREDDWIWMTFRRRNG